MRAARLQHIKEALAVMDIPAPEPKPGYTSVTMQCAALNRRDYWMQQGLYPRITLPVTPGSDGAGTVDGKPVVINPGLHWGNQEAFQSSDFHILGMPADGTFAQQVSVPGDHIFPMPDHLSWEQGAALPLAGVTAYRALFVQGEARTGEKILITGIGGGVALMAAQMALAHGMEVSVTSGSEAKLAKASEMGIAHAINYHDPDWAKSLVDSHGQFDMVLDSAGGKPFSDLVRTVKPGGRIILYGGTLGKIQELSPQVLFWRQISIRGTSMGSQQDFTNMLDFVNAHRITPVVDSVYTLDEINTAMNVLGNGTQFGKVVIRIPE